MSFGDSDSIGFESSVILEGSKTHALARINAQMFESSVILEGSKTVVKARPYACEFESSVILEGSKTKAGRKNPADSLRVVLF